MVADRVCVVNEDELIQWADSLGEAELEYLFELASKEHESTIREASTQDGRIVALFGWSIVGIGTLALTDALSLSADLQGVASMLAIAATVIALVAGTYAIWPRDLAQGIEVSWYADKGSMPKRRMQILALAALISATSMNYDFFDLRSAAIRFMAAALMVQLVTIILALIADAVSR